MAEEETLVRMEHAENIAKEFFKSLIKRKSDMRRMAVADILHVGVVLGTLIVDMASRSCDVQKEEVLEQYIEALTDYVEENAFEAIPLN